MKIMMRIAEGEIMKKFFACLAALLLVFSIGVGAFSEVNYEYGGGVISGKITALPGAGSYVSDNVSMNVKFNVDESFTVTIPASIELTGSFVNGFSGSATIKAEPQLCSGGLFVSLVLPPETVPSYNDNVAVNGGDAISKIVFHPKILDNGTQRGEATVTVTGKGMTAIGKDAGSGIRVLSATGTTGTSNELNYSVSGLSGLTSGSYSFSQTFNITVDKLIQG